MANFDSAFERLLPDEGGWSDRPNDLGGETILGISRRANPDWEGWIYVDAGRDDPNFPQNVENDSRILRLAKSLYKHRYWDPVGGNHLRNQRLVDILFSIRVNSPPKTAIRFLQEALQYLSLNGERYRPTEIDGRFGPDTIRALEAYLAAMNGSEEAYDRLAWFVTAQWACRYADIVRSNPPQAENAKGWIDRTRRFWT